MKRFFALTLSVLIVLGLVSLMACQKQEAPAEETVSQPADTAPADEAVPAEEEVMEEEGDVEGEVAPETGEEAPEAGEEEPAKVPPAEE